MSTSSAAPWARGSSLEQLLEVGAHDARVGAELVEDAWDDAAVLVEQRDEQVLGPVLGVMARDRALACGCERFARLDGELFQLHDSG